ncbi:MAG TPA: AMP-binding protein [Bosea sp. (in: a-proteobacteria)]|jgi:malonyl-CoA/methylmalonyl-CoA synthetase|uniref:AMP-binding protein n=1 Tax=Bosea sp. (in: a-proteobacteria) TaxID=1871050 RepID=UPI002E0D3BED|nr:AMP-binding protein [Bosea sp. (in: a-proteobacteria)]
MTSPVEVPDDANVYAALIDPNQNPARIFIETETGRTVAFGAIAGATARFAALLARQGVSRGRIVAGILEKSPEAIMLYLAASRLGAIYLPVHIGLTDGEIAHILADAEPITVVCDPVREGAVRAAGHPRILTLASDGTGTLASESEGLDGIEELAVMAPSEPNAMVYTSGTTGKPKGALISCGAVIWNARALAQAWQITAGDTLLHANPMAYGLFGTTTPALAGGAAMILLPKFETEAVLRQLPRATMFSGVPTYYSRLLADPRFDATLCAGMRLFVTGSAPMRADSFAAFAERSGHVLLDRYGLTEALIVSSNTVADARRPDTSGLALPGSRLRVVDEQGQEIAPGEVGKIELLQPYPFLGYWRDEAKTRAAFRDDWFITGDFGRLDANGYLSVLGRGADLIITGGLNVYPKEIETAVNALDGVMETAVIGVPHRDFGEAVVAVVQLRAGTAFDPQDAIVRLKRELAGYKVPKRIEIVPEMPRNTLGKIQKNLLKQRFFESFAG